MKSKSPILPERIRRISGSFSWLDHRLLHSGFLRLMQPEEMLLYFFLVLVGDRNGVSFYGYDSILRILKLTLDQYIAARNRLVDLSLIAFEDGRYQVLELPDAPQYLHPTRSREIKSIKQVLDKISPRLTMR
jgi:hypothetical protein